MNIFYKDDLPKSDICFMKVMLLNHETYFIRMTYLNRIHILYILDIPIPLTVKVKYILDRLHQLV